MYLLRSKRKREVLVKSFVYVVLIVTSIIILIPIFWMISTALKEDSEVYLFPPEWIPKNPQFGNFKRALTFSPFGRYFANTSIITFATMVGTLLSSSIVAYGFARLRARGRDVLFMILLSTMMIPPQVTMIPVFALFKLLNWTDTFKPLIIPNFFGGAFFIFYYVNSI